MTDVLSRIVAHKKEEIAGQRRETPESTYLRELAPSDRDFKAALQREGPAFILECKMASPSRGLLRPDFDLDQIAAVYGRHADAISVLTDSTFFGGHSAHLSHIRARVRQPLLNKDFFIDPYQVYRARYHGADAILLMLSILDDARYRELAALAHEWNMDVLTEAHTEEEVQRALKLQADILGINNRNLKDLSIDRDTTRRLAPKADSSRVIVSESGFYTRRNVRDLKDKAVAFLVGSALMAESDLEAAVKRLIYGEVKICGLTRPEDARAAHEAGALYGGMIFAPRSARCLSEETARALRSSAPLNWVAVFADQDAAEVARLARVLHLHAVQLHGRESAEYITNLRALLPPECEIWRALPVDGDIPPSPPREVDRIALDSAGAAGFGGSGHTFDWRLIEQRPPKQPTMLAGGLTPENIQQALDLPVSGFDLSSGVESAPGIKDRRKIEKLFNIIRRH